jgi:hypothetical protein
MKDLLNKLNPENNLKVRAFFYAIGIAGSTHLIFLIIWSFVRQDPDFFNPVYVMDFHLLWPATLNSALSYILGWILFVSLITIIYKRISKK